jgi:hypothetical protein
MPARDRDRDRDRPPDRDRMQDRGRDRDYRPARDHDRVSESERDRERRPDRGLAPDREHLSSPRAKSVYDDVAGYVAPEKDLRQIQGLWVQTTPGEGFFSKPRRTTKEVKGDTETVTYYDGNGEVVRAHTAKIRLGRAGPLKTFTYYDITYTAGPNKGQKGEGEKTYVYKIPNDTFVEIWGVLDDSDARVHALRWKRENPTQR